jgi:hypothetical protein
MFLRAAACPDEGGVVIAATLPRHAYAFSLPFLYNSVCYSAITKEHTHLRRYIKAGELFPTMSQVL